VQGVHHLTARARRRNTVRDCQDGRDQSHERVNAVFLNEGGEACEYRVGIELLKRDGLIDMHDTGTYFRLTEKGAQRFA
jgi:hypothetical protein